LQAHSWDGRDEVKVYWTEVTIIVPLIGLLWLLSVEQVNT